jgi:hypothetical protein
MSDPEGPPDARSLKGMPHQYASCRTPTCDLCRIRVDRKQPAAPISPERKRTVTVPLWLKTGRAAGGLA